MISRGFSFLFLVFFNIIYPFLGSTRTKQVIKLVAGMQQCVTKQVERKDGVNSST